MKQHLHSLAANMFQLYSLCYINYSTLGNKSNVILAPCLNTFILVYFLSLNVGVSVSAICLLLHLKVAIILLCGYNKKKINVVIFIKQSCSFFILTQTKHCIYCTKSGFK